MSDEMPSLVPAADWACVACTLINRASSRSCDVCGKSAPTPKAASARPQFSIPLHSSSPSQKGNLPYTPKKMETLSTTVDVEEASTTAQDAESEDFLEMVFLREGEDEKLHRGGQQMPKWKQQLWQRVDKILDEGSQKGLDHVRDKIQPKRIIDFPYRDTHGLQLTPDQALFERAWIFEVHGMDSHTRLILHGHTFLKWKDREIKYPEPQKRDEKITSVNWRLATRKSSQSEWQQDSQGDTILPRHKDLKKWKNYFPNETKHKEIEWEWRQGSLPQKEDKDDCTAQSYKKIGVLLGLTQAMRIVETSSVRQTNRQIRGGKEEANEIEEHRLEPTPFLQFNTKLSKMSVEEVAIWMRGVTLFGDRAEKYANKMTSEHIDGEGLVKLTEGDLKELGLSMGDRKKLLDLISCPQTAAAASSITNQSMTALGPVTAPVTLGDVEVHEKKEEAPITENAGKIPRDKADEVEAHDFYHIIRSRTAGVCLEQKPLSDGNFRVIFLGANSREDAKLQLEEEAKKMFKNFREGFGDKWLDACKFEVSQFANYDSMSDSLKDHKPHAVHFACHGENGELELDGDQIDVKKLANALRPLLNEKAQDPTLLLLIILNACNSDALAHEVWKALGYSVSIIGHCGAVPDDAAVRFTERLYKALGRLSTVKDAFVDGATYAANGREPTKKYVLYAGRNADTFKLREPKTEQEKRREKEMAELHRQQAEQQAKMAEHNRHQAEQQARIAAQEARMAQQQLERHCVGKKFELDPSFQYVRLCVNCRKTPEEHHRSGPRDVKDEHKYCLSLVDKTYEAEQYITPVQENTTPQNNNAVVSSLTLGVGGVGGLGSIPNQLGSIANQGKQTVLLRCKNCHKEEHEHYQTNGKKYCRPISDDIPFHWLAAFCCIPLCLFQCGMEVCRKINPIVGFMVMVVPIVIFAAIASAASNASGNAWGGIIVVLVVLCLGFLHLCVSWLAWKTKKQEIREFLAEEAENGRDSQAYGVSSLNSPRAPASSRSTELTSLPPRGTSTPMPSGPSIQVIPIPLQMGAMALPPSANMQGWREAFDPQTGRRYYQNEITKTTQWERPW